LQILDVGFRLILEGHLEGDDADLFLDAIKQTKHLTFNDLLVLLEKAL
jgi:hypothetical protein